MILFDIPPSVQRFFAPIRAGLSRPIANSLPVMVLALLLAPARRCLKTLAGAVLGRREHASTISRRLRNAAWRTRDWFVSLYNHLLEDVHRWERRVARQQPRRRRCWMAVIDTTYHSTHSECMENLILFNRSRGPNRRQVRQHAFVMGFLITEYGMRIPLPRRSYYTQEYCRNHNRRYRTQVGLAAEMLQDICLPDDVELTVVFDSAFDANAVHRICRGRHFRAVFPLDPNRTLSAGPEVEAAGLVGQKVVHWTRTWHQQEFTLLELQYANENHVFFRRRHRDNLRLAKTMRRYAVAARETTVSNLGTCLVVASYKENPSVTLLPNQSSNWWDYHRLPVPYDRHQRPRPQRWHPKVLVCTDSSVTARQVVEWYEIRWQIELFFRELKSRMQFGCYVLKKFEAVERYLDLLLMGFLLLENERFQALRAGGREQRCVGEPAVQRRTTDALRSLESLCHNWNVGILERCLRTETGRRRLLRRLRQAIPCHVS
jgi:Transposase DDE domain